jgi:hypothetical protein
VDGRVTNQWGKSTGNVFKNNVFFGNHANLPEAFGSITNRPPLVQPGSGKDGFASLGGYKLRKGAALGVLVPQNGGRDFFGHRVPPDKPPAIGAVQMP